MLQGDGTRPYRKRKRARQEAETRRRITEAVVELHRTVGPSKTTVTDVAGLAGVSRMTVYNHFPTDADLIEACSTHWSARNPAPPPSSWAGVAGGPQRLTVALTELYRWYRTSEDMMARVLRDAPIVGPLGELMDARWRPYLEEVVRSLAAAWPVDPVEAWTLEVALRVAVDFHTWQVLARSGMDDHEAAELAVRMATAAVG
jgi:AcrR family transcriptional regulator